MRRGVCAFLRSVLRVACLRARCARVLAAAPVSGRGGFRCSDSVHRAIGFGCGDVCTVFLTSETNKWQSVLHNDSTASFFG